MLEALRDIVIEAGRRLTSAPREADDRGTNSRGHSITEAEFVTNNYLAEALLDLKPHAGWLSEESLDNAERLGREWVWIVDPLDGTKEYRQGVPEYAISIGLVRRGEIVAGAVFNPVSGEGAVADVDEQSIFAFTWERADLVVLEREAIDARANARHAIPVSRSEYTRSPMQALLAEGIPVAPVGSIAYRLMRVALGHAPLTVTLRPKSEWDVAGGVALLRATGRDYLRLDDAPLRFNQRGTLIDCGAVAGPIDACAQLRAQIERILG